MTYLQYHLLFIVPVLALLFWLTAQRRGPLAGNYGASDRWTWGWLAALVGVAVAYTTPWDNYLVFKQVWTYPPERVLGRIGYVPYEEYAFFVLQTLIAGLFLLWLMRRGGQKAAVSPNPALTRWGGAAFLLALSFVGVWCLRQPSSFYLGLILAWAMPVLAGQWAFGGDLILGRARLFWAAVLLPTLYLWLTDAYALHAGIWHIAERYTVGLYAGPLPFEEALFFLVTNLLVVTGLLLFLHPLALTRLERARPYLKPWLGFAALSFLVRIAVPHWPEGFALLGTLSTGLTALAALAYAWEKAGLLRALLAAALCFGLGWAVEYLGSRTGFPFGAYSYAGAPGPTLLGVPLLVPLGWFAMPLFASLWSGGRVWLAGLLLVAWDIGLEPLMTTPLGGQHSFWTWHDPHPVWAGAPVQNFLGWWAVGAGLSWLLGQILGQTVKPSDRQTAFLSPGWLYPAEAAFLPAGLWLLGMPGAALVALAAMGLAAFLAWRMK